MNEYTTPIIVNKIANTVHFELSCNVPKKHNIAATNIKIPIKIISNIIYFNFVCL